MSLYPIRPFCAALGNIRTYIFTDAFIAFSRYDYYANEGDKKAVVDVILRNGELEVPVTVR